MTAAWGNCLTFDTLLSFVDERIVALRRPMLRGQFEPARLAIRL